MDFTDMKVSMERLFKPQEYLRKMKIRHTARIQRKSSAKEELKIEEILRRQDGTPLLLNVLGYDQLIDIKTMFITEREGMVSKEKFQGILDTYCKILNLTALQFQRIFFMIDLDQDEMVTWHDLMEYLYQEEKEKDILMNGLRLEPIEPPINVPPKFVPSKHTHCISSVAFWPSITQAKKPDYSAGRYVTVSKEGCVDFWNLDLKHLYSASAAAPVPTKFTTSCITKIVPMADLNMVCICSMDREIRFYDAVADSFRLRTIIDDFRHGLVAMEYHFYETDSIKSWVAVGDTQGNLYVLMFSPNAAKTIFAQVVDLPYTSARYCKVVVGAIPGLKVIEFPGVHPTWIESMAYYDEFISLVTTCNNPRSSVVLINIFSNSIIVKIDLSHGVTCAAKLTMEPKESIKWKGNRFNHYLVTAGCDTDIRIWNLDRPSKPKSIIKGKTGQIIAVIVDEDNNDKSWIYTYAMEGIITIWDARNKDCIQVYKKNLDRFGLDSQLAICYNPYFKTLLIAGFKICILKIGKTININHTVGYTNDKEITVALFNYLYDVIVTCGTDSVISKWHAFTGVKMNSWAHAHSGVLLTETVSFGITAGTFSPDQSLLATGASNGSIKMWNFHTGTCLREMEMEQGPVLKLIWLKTRFFGLGMESSYREWGPSVKNTTMKELPKKWHRTVTAACFVPPVTIIIGDVFGELLFCNYNCGKVYKRYYVHEPSRNLTMDIDYADDQKNTRNLVFDKKRHNNVGGVVTCAIHCIYYLKKRNQEENEGNILVSLDTGMIQVWSAHPKGALVASFYAVHMADDYTVNMEADTNNDHLFTGSSEGYLKLWSLKNFATQEKSILSLPQLRLKYAYLADTLWTTRSKKGVVGQPLPILLNSYRAHGMAITSIIFIDFCQLVITAGCDRSVRYWSMTGQYLNQLGSVLPWITVDPSSTVVVKKLRIPPELRRVMSYMTMKVLTNGYRLTKNGTKELVASDLKATAHIHRRMTNRTPHGQGISSELVTRYLILPDMVTKPAVAPVLGNLVNVHRHLQTCKMEKVEIVDVAPPLQQKVKTLFMDSLERAGVPKFTKVKKVRKPSIALHDIKAKVMHDNVWRKMQALTKEDLHPHAFGNKVREALIANVGAKKSNMELPCDKTVKYFKEPQGTFLWKQKKFEADADVELRRERMVEMLQTICKHSIRETKRTEMWNEIEMSREYLSGSILTKMMRMGRIRDNVNRLNNLEENMGVATGPVTDTSEQKIDKIQVATVHDCVVEHRKKVKNNFWSPLFTSDENNIDKE